MAEERETYLYDIFQLRNPDDLTPCLIISFSFGEEEKWKRHHYQTTNYSIEKLEGIYSQPEHIVALFRVYPLKQNPYNLNNRQ